MADAVEEFVGANRAPGALRSLAVNERRQFTDTDVTPVEYAVQLTL